MNSIYDGKIRFCLVDTTDIDDMHQYDYILIEGTVDVKAFVEHDEIVQPIPVDSIFGRLLWNVDHICGPRHYVVLSDGCLYDVSDWSPKALLELMFCKNYASLSMDIQELRTFLEL